MPRPPFGQGFQSSSQPLGKVDKWIVRFLILAAILYSFAYVESYIFVNDQFTRDATAFLAALALLKAMMVNSPASPNQGRATVIIAVLVPLAIFNALISESMVETSLRWVLWFVIVMSLTKVANASEGTWLPAAVRRFPIMFSILWLTLFVVAHVSDDQRDIRFAFHLSGLYGNLILATGLFAGKLWHRLLWIPLGFFAIFASGAGGALFTIPIMFVPYILYSTTSMPVKGMAIAAMLLLGGTFFFESQLFESFLNIKVNNALGDEAGFNGLARLENSENMRLQLVQVGFDVAKEHPFGTGLGHTYADEIKPEFGVPHVHNGTLSMIIELGFPGFAMVATVVLWIFWNILNSPLIDKQIKAFYFTYFFTCFGRSLSENYTLFDLGNFFNLVFLLLTASLFLCQRASQRTNQPTPVRGRPMPMRPPMGPPPRWNRPVGAR